MVIKNKNKKVYRWRLNENLLEKAENVEYIRKEIDMFFENNWDKEVKNFIEWDTFKAFIRGILIALNIKIRGKGVKKL